MFELLVDVLRNKKCTISLPKHPNAANKQRKEENRLTVIRTSLHVCLTWNNIQSLKGCRVLRVACDNLPVYNSLPSMMCAGSF